MGIFKKHPTLVLGISITILFLALAFMRAGFLDTLDLKLYDVGMSLRSDPESFSNIVMVDIDDDTIEKLGRWPWPRRMSPSRRSIGTRRPCSASPACLFAGFAFFAFNFFFSNRIYIYNS